VIVVLDADRAELDLVAGRIACPRCGGRLRPWAWARARSVRCVDGSVRVARPRRARCRDCRATRVLLPSWCQPRLADTTEGVGAALAANAAGRGRRRIAADLDRSPSTVRRWLRRARDPGHLEQLRQRGILRAREFDREVLAAGLRSQPTALGDALEALLPRWSPGGGGAARVSTGGRWLGRSPAGGCWLLPPFDDQQRVLRG